MTGADLAPISKSGRISGHQHRVGEPHARASAPWSYTWFDHKLRSSSSAQPRIDPAQVLPALPFIEAAIEVAGAPGIVGPRITDCTKAIFGADRPTTMRTSLSVRVRGACRRCAARRRRRSISAVQARVPGHGRRCRLNFSGGGLQRHPARPGRSMALKYRQCRRATLATGSCTAPVVAANLLFARPVHIRKQVPPRCTPSSSNSRPGR